MSTVSDFFRRHHAIRGTDAGPDFRLATDDALLGWWEGKTNPLHAQIVAEVKRRAMLPGASDAIKAAARLS